MPCSRGGGGGVMSLPLGGNKLAPNFAGTGSIANVCRLKNAKNFDGVCRKNTLCKVFHYCLSNACFVIKLPIITISKFSNLIVHQQP